jgi:hypothetical protein
MSLSRVPNSGEEPEVAGPETETRREVCRVAEIVGPRTSNGLVDHPVDIEGDRPRFGVFKNLSLDIGQPG